MIRIACEYACLGEWAGIIIERIKKNLQNRTQIFVEPFLPKNNKNFRVTHLNANRIKYRAVNLIKLRTTCVWHIVNKRIEIPYEINLIYILRHANHT